MSMLEVLKTNKTFSSYLGAITHQECINIVTSEQERVNNEIESLETTYAESKRLKLSELESDLRNKSMMEAEMERQKELERRVRYSTAPIKPKRVSTVQSALPTARQAVTSETFSRI